MDGGGGAGIARRISSSSCVATRPRRDLLGPPLPEALSDRPFPILSPDAAGGSSARRTRPEALLRTREPLKLPARGSLPKPEADDPLDYYYRPLTAALYRSRLEAAAELLGDEHHATLLEVGYGSGIFMPELARHADRVLGIDIHGQSAAVSEALARIGVTAELSDADLFALPFADDSLDALVCLSVLEHLTDLDGALAEFRRVVRPGGILVLGVPVRNPATDLFFRAVGYNPRAIHPSSHSDMLAAARRAPGLVVEAVRRVPSFLPLPLAAYVTCRCSVR